MNTDPQEQAELAFRPVEPDDLPMIDAWLRSEQIGKWWGDPDKQMAKISARLDQNWLIQEIILLDGEPVGYLQHYDCADDPVDYWHLIKPKSWAIDIMIGKTGMVSKGLGTRVLEDCCERIFAHSDAERIVIDTMPDNARAIRCYEKAGFFSLGLMDTPSSVIQLMVFERPE